MTPNISPILRYTDGHAAINWLVEAFGFEKQGVFDAADGGVAHAELKIGNGVIGLSSAGQAKPDNPWSSVRQGVYVTVTEVDALHDRARAAGADIVSPLKDLDYGSREFGARDLDGHLWGFGTYAMAKEGEPNVFPGLHYRDSRAALDWLERAFGFTKTLEVPSSDGSIAHAESRLGDGTIFLESGPRDRAVWGDNTQAIYVRVADPDEHHRRAVSAGATIIKAPHDTPWGRGYDACDLEGFVWGFSTDKPAS
jgi:uncharacterized glyoxalase superfamily protein PhnB